MTSEFISLPNGNSIRADTIFAVRLGDGKEYDDPYRVSLKPRVIIDFGLTGDRIGAAHANCVICNCETDEERNALAASIMSQWRDATGSHQTSRCAAQRHLQPGSGSGRSPL